MKKAFWRCNSGHYFSSSTCPMDGWSGSYSHRLFELVSQMRQYGQEVSIEGLIRNGLEKEALDRLIIIEFAPESATFDGIIPEGYIINGTFVPLRKLDRKYL
jgi:hypothetical protein